MDGCVQSPDAKPEKVGTKNNPLLGEKISSKNRKRSGERKNDK